MSEETETKNVHDAIGIPGILNAQVPELEKKKLQIRQENEKYLRTHPELSVMIQLFMKEVLDEHPENVLEFAGSFFDREALKDEVNFVMNAQG